MSSIFILMLVRISPRSRPDSDIFVRSWRSVRVHASALARKPESHTERGARTYTPTRAQHQVQTSAHTETHTNTHRAIRKKNFDTISRSKIAYIQTSINIKLMSFAVYALCTRAPSMCTYVWMGRGRRLIATIPPYSNAPELLLLPKRRASEAQCYFMRRALR